MGNRKLIYFFAIILSCVFTVFYYVIFSGFEQPEKKTEKQSLYMNQVGLYAQEESVTNTMKKLQDAGLDAYRKKSGDLIAVVSGVNTTKKETEKQQEQLNALNINFILKKITTSDSAAISAIQSKDYATALELMKE